LNDRLYDIQSKEYENVLEIGSRKGNLTKYLIEMEGTKNLVMMDNSEEMLNKAMQNIINLKENNEKKNEINIEGVIADEEDLPFQDEQFDLIVSNLNLHWVNDLQSTFQRINNFLKPNGVFLASLFGDQTLLELQ
jgi:NADH dehydrogenase [ubiquinone] 1 alpha subcomplex assembly factor 5